MPRSKILFSEILVLTERDGFVEWDIPFFIHLSCCSEGTVRGMLRELEREGYILTNVDLDTCKKMIYTTDKEK